MATQSVHPLRSAPPLLARAWFPFGAILLALLLVSPGLGGGRLGDDYMHMARVDPRLRVPGFAYAPFDLFTFVSGDPAQRAVLAAALVDDARGRPPALAALAVLYRRFHASISATSAGSAWT